MNSRALGSFLVLLSMSGCAIYGDGYGGGGRGVRGGRPGNVQFTWSFVGLTCSDVPEVRSVAIQIDGEVLQNDGIFPCSSNGYPGILLHDFAPGTYSFTVNAIDYGNRPIYAAAGTFTIDGDVRVAVDLTPVGGGSSYAFLTWRFPASVDSPSPSCAQAGITFVDVTIDASTQRYDCLGGTTDVGVQTGFLPPGRHAIRLNGLTSNGYPIYQVASLLTTYAGRPVSATYLFGWAVGGVALQWQLLNGITPQTCAQAGVQTVYIDFQNSAGNFVYGPNGDPQPCDGAPISYNFLQPDNYRIFLRGVGPSGVAYLSSTQNPPRITVVAGQFASPAQALTVNLYRVP